MALYKILAGSHNVRKEDPHTGVYVGKLYEKGEVVDIHPDVANSFPGKFERVPSVREVMALNQAHREDAEDIKKGRNIVDGGADGSVKYDADTGERI